MKLIHCSDLHLDSPMGTHLGREKARGRNLEIVNTFTRLTEYAGKNGVGAVLIAGDLFDGERVSQRTVDEVFRAVSATPGVEYLYVPGNHDETASVLSGGQSPENFKQIGDRWETFSFDGVSVSGIMITEENAVSLYEQLPEPEEGLHIVMLHGQTGTAAGTDQVNLNLLKGRGIDYLALGHLHSYTKAALDERGVYCYCGCLEGRGFDECGEKGFVLLDAEDGRLRSRFVPFAKRTLHRISVNVTGLTTDAEAYSAMLESAKEIGRENMVEFELTGETDPRARISAEHLRGLAGQEFFFAAVKDRTRLAVRPEDYQNDISLKGEFIRLVLASGADEADQARIIRAGLEALSGEEVIL